MRSECPRREAGIESGKGLEFCIAAHAEVNAIVHAARNGINIMGCEMIVYGASPCKDCALYIVNSGIKKVYVLDRFGMYNDFTRKIFIQGEVNMEVIKNWGKNSKFDYLLNIALAISEKSKCMSRKIGAIILRDDCIISTGYNGPARNVDHCDIRDWMLPKRRELEGGKYTS